MVGFLDDLCRTAYGDPGFGTLLLVLDEVVTAFGRTGRLFAHEHWGIVPDLLVLAKALGGGLPLGAFVGAPAIMSTLRHDPPLAHVTTFGGHPLSCAAGLAALDVLERGAEEVVGTVVPEADRLYVSIDLDVLDASVAPGHSLPEPGGLDYRELRAILAAVARRGRVIGFDVVELNPARDPSGATARVATWIVTHFLSEIFERPAQSPRHS